MKTKGEGSVETVKTMLRARKSEGMRPARHSDCKRGLREDLSVSEIHNDKSCPGSFPSKEKREGWTYIQASRACHHFRQRSMFGAQGIRKWDVRPN